MPYAFTLRPRSFPLLLGVVLALLSGCRTYGDRGNEEAMLAQIREASRLQADEARRARADFELLSEAAAGDPTLRSYTEDYEHLLARQEAVLERARGTAEDVDEGNYRDLHRAYGAMISRQRTLRQQYDELLREIAHGNLPIPEVRRGDVEEERYAVVPTYYRRAASEANRLTMREANRLTMREALRARTSNAANPAQSGPPVTVQENVPGPTEANAVQPGASPAQEPAFGPDSSAAADSSTAADSSVAGASAN